jgi:hypothetical protein
MFNNGQPLMGYDDETDSTTTNNNYNVLGTAMTNNNILGAPQAGYKTMIVDIPNIIAHTNSGGNWYPVVTNLFPSAGELNGTGFRAFNQNVLAPLGMKLGLLVDSGTNDGHGAIGIGGYWSSDIIYATTNWGVTAWVFADSVNQYYYYNQTMQCLLGVQAAGGNPWIALCNFSDNNSSTNADYPGFNFLNHSAVPFWSGKINDAMIEDFDPTSYMAWYTNFFKYTVPALPLEAPGLAIDQNLIYPFNDTAAEHANTIFEMSCLTRASLILAGAALNPYPNYGVWTAWVVLNPSLIAVDQNISRPPVYQAFTTNGVTFFVGAGDATLTPKTWYVAVWNTNATAVTNVSIPTSALNLQGWLSGTPLTVWDASMQATYTYATNTLTFTNYLNGGSGWFTNLAPGAATLYYLKKGIVSDWTSQTCYLSDGHPIGMSNGASFTVVGFNRQQWNGNVLTAVTNIVNVSTYLGGTTPVKYIETEQTPTILTYSVWPATNFSGTLAYPDGFSVPSTNLISMAVYTNGVLVTNITQAGSGVSAGGSTPFSIGISGATTMTLVLTNNPIDPWNTILNPALTLPYYTAYDVNGNVQSLPFLQTNSLGGTIALIATNTGNLYAGTVSNANFAGTATGTLQSSVVTGNTTGTPAATGIVGEQLSTSIIPPSAITVQNGVTTNFFVTLTAGVWRISGLVTFAESTASVSARAAVLSLTANGMTGSGTTPYIVYNDAATSSLSDTNSLVIPTRVFVCTTATTNAYVNILNNYSAGSVTAYGYLSAIRNN